MVEKKLKCPECGWEHHRPQQIGVHRRQAHGILGDSKSAISLYKKQTREADTDTDITSNGATSNSVEAKMAALAAAVEAANNIPTDIKTSPSPAEDQSAASDKKSKYFDKDGKPRLYHGVYHCPECDRKFKRTVLLGVHRRMAHGVHGTSLGAKAMQRKKAALEQGSVSPQTAHQPALPGLETDFEPAVSVSGPFACEVCKTSFPTERGLNGHKARAHKKLSPNGQVIVHQPSKGEANGINGSGLSPTPLTAPNQSCDPNQVSSEEASAAVQYALIVGGIRERCRNIAEEQGFITRDFTRRVAELFYRETRR